MPWGMHGLPCRGTEVCITGMRKIGRNLADRYRSAEFEVVDMRDFAFPSDKDVPRLLDEYHDLAVPGKRYAKLGKQIKSWSKNSCGVNLGEPDIAVRLLLPRWVIEILTSSRIVYDVPEDVKQRYARASTIVDQRFLSKPGLDG